MRWTSEAHRESAESHGQQTLVMRYATTTSSSICIIPTYLTHVRHIEQGRLAVATAPQVLLHDAAVLPLVQDGQLVPSEGDHVAAELLVEVV